MISRENAEKIVSALGEKEITAKDLAEALGVPVSDIDSEFSNMSRQFVRFFFYEGMSNEHKDKLKNIDAQELKWGIEIEMEHTKNPLIAAKIARDHLAEDPKYYTHLRAMEKAVREGLKSAVME